MYYTKLTKIFQTKSLYQFYYISTLYYHLQTKYHYHQVLKEETVLSKRQNSFYIKILN